MNSNHCCLSLVAGMVTTKMTQRSLYKNSSSFIIDIQASHMQKFRHLGQMTCFVALLNEKKLHILYSEHFNTQLLYICCVSHIGKIKHKICCRCKCYGTFYIFCFISFQYVKLCKKMELCTKICRKMPLI